MFDENMNIFLYDTSIYAVHVFLVNSQYLCQLLSLFDIKNEPNRIAINKERRLLYVGQQTGLVQMYKLKYD